MVRINIINPDKLADQHLIAEYNEILMLLGHVRKHPEIKNQPKEYVLGPGHINFFKDKLAYLKKRHEAVKEEMRRRGFKPEVTIDLTQFDLKLRKDWSPAKKDEEIIKQRLRHKLQAKPDYYRYYGDKQSLEFYLRMLD